MSRIKKMIAGGLLIGAAATYVGSESVRTEVNGAARGVLSSEGDAYRACTYTFPAVTPNGRGGYTFADKSDGEVCVPLYGAADADPAKDKPRAGIWPPSNFTFLGCAAGRGGNQMVVVDLPIRDERLYTPLNGELVGQVPQDIPELATCRT